MREKNFIFFNLNLIIFIYLVFTVPHQKLLMRMFIETKSKHEKYSYFYDSSSEIAAVQEIFFKTVKNETLKFFLIINLMSESTQQHGRERYNKREEL